MKQHKVIIINRWDDELSLYKNYIDHTFHDVAYIANKEGSKIEMELAKAIRILSDLSDRVAIIDAAREIRTILGGVTKIIAMSEFDLEIAGFLRDCLDVPGIKEKQALVYRDKIIMKNTISKAGLCVPCYADSVEHSVLTELINQCGYPLILKPRKGAASKGVAKINNATELDAMLQKISSDEYECEQYISGSIYHIDGIVQNGDILFHTVSRYLNNCLDFNNGEPLGSVVIDDEEMILAITDFTQVVLKALDFKAGIFHLELIRDSSNHLYFLEIGARLGGGEIPFIMHDIYHLNLTEVWSKIEFDQDISKLLDQTATKKITGFLMIPEPKVIPCKVNSCETLLKSIKYLYKEIIPSPGHIFKGDGGYSDISGRFRYQGPSTQAVEDSIHQTIQAFSLDVEHDISIIS